MRRFWAALAAALMVGCAGPDAFERSEAPAVEVVGDLAPQRVWERSVGAAAGLQDRLIPAYDEGRVFAASADGRLVALDAQSGETLWQRELEGRLSGGPAAADGLIVIGTREGEVIALSAQTGETRWISGVTSEVLAPAAIGQGVVAVRTNDGRVFALQRDSGERLWLYDRNVPTLSVRGHSAPVLVDGGVVVGFDNGRLAALSLGDGSPIWEASVAVPRGQTDLDRMVDIDADPLVRSGAVFAVAYQGRVAGVSLGEGRVAWARELSGYAGLTLVGRRLVVPDADGHVWALDASNGASVWRQDALEGLVLTAPAVHDGYPVVAGSDGFLNWLAADDGRVLARRQVAGTRIASAPLAANGMLYVLSTGGELQAWRLADR